MHHYNRSYQLCVLLALIVITIITSTSSYAQINYVPLIKEVNDNLIQGLESIEKEINKGNIEKSENIKESLLKNLFIDDKKKCIEKFYTQQISSSLLYTPRDFLNDYFLSFEILNYEKKKGSSYSLCKDAKGRHFASVTLSLNIVFNNLNKSKTTKSVDLYFSYYFKRINNKEKALIGNISLGNSKQRINCSKEVSAIPSIPFEQQPTEQEPIVGFGPSPSANTEPSPKSPKPPTGGGVSSNSPTQSIERELRKALKECEENIDNYSMKISLLEDDTSELNKKNRLSQDSIILLTSIIDCVRKFQLRRDSTKLLAEIKLSQADTAYHYFKNVDTSDDIKKDTLYFAWDIYMKYGISSDTAICPHLPLLRDYEDYMSARQHFNAASILAMFDDEDIEKSYNIRIIDSLGDNAQARLNKMTELILIEIGRVYDKTKYNDISDGNDLSEELPKLLQVLPYMLFPERKSQDGEGGNLEVIKDIQSIFEDYSRKDYPKSIETFNKYYRIFEMKGIKENKNEILLAKYAAGSILLWDLIDFEKNKGLIQEGSWLYKNLDNRRQKGKKLLYEFIEKTNDEELKKKAIISLKKHYQPK